MIVPKVENAEDLGTAGAGVGERAGTPALQALIESARAAGRGDRRAAGGRLEALILGPADLSVSLGFPSPREGSRWDFVRGAILVAARSAGLQAIDGPFLQISDLEGLRRLGAARPGVRLRRQVGAPPRPDRAAERGLLAQPR